MPQFLNKLENTLENYLVDKAPSLPINAKAFIVNLLPWLSLVLLIFGLPVFLAFFGISAFLLPFSFIAGFSNGINHLLAMIVLGITLIIIAISIPGLFKQTKKGWRLIYYATLLHAVYNIVTFNIFGLLIGSLLSLYILFQIKTYFKR